MVPTMLPLAALDPVELNELTLALAPVALKRELRKSRQILQLLQLIKLLLLKLALVDSNKIP